MDVAVKPARGQDAPFTGDSLGAGANDNIDTWLRVRVARLSDLENAPVFQADIGLEDTAVIDNQRVGDHGVSGSSRTGGLGLPHAIADHFSATEFDLFAVGREIIFHLDDQIGIGQSQAIPGGGAEHGGIIGT